MDVDQRGLHIAAAGKFPEHRVEGGKGIVEGALHEDLPQGLRHQHLTPAARLIDARARTRRILGEIERAQDARLLRDELQHVALVEGVIAQGQAIGTGIEQFLGMASRQARASGRILAVDHDEIEAPVGAECGQMLGDRGAPCPPHHVAKKKDTHGLGLGAGARRGKRENAHHCWVAGRITPVSVTMASRAISVGSRGKGGNSCAAKAKPMARTGLEAARRASVRS